MHITLSQSLEPIHCDTFASPWGDAFCLNQAPLLLVVTCVTCWNAPVEFNFSAFSPVSFR